MEIQVKPLNAFGAILKKVLQKNYFLIKEKR